MATRRLHDPLSEQDEDLTSRSDERRASKLREQALARLGKELVSLNKRQLERLELEEPLLEALDHARAIKSPIARERQLRIVRRELRDADWPRIRARLDELLVHGTVGPERQMDAAVRHWVVELVAGGDRALDLLLAEHPNADRKHLRQLVRSAEKSPPERRRRAEGRLADALASLIRQ